jgi:hypothetical protein
MSLRACFGTFLVLCVACGSERPPPPEFDAGLRDSARDTGGDGGGDDGGDLDGGEDDGGDLDGGGGDGGGGDDAGDTDGGGGDDGGGGMDAAGTDGGGGSDGGGGIDSGGRDAAPRDAALTDGSPDRVCQAAAECTACPFPTAVTSAADCYCECAEHPVPADLCTAHRTLWLRFCDPDDCDPPAGPTCGPPIAVDCVDGMCVED